MKEDERPLLGEPIFDLDEETTGKITEVILRKYRMFADTDINGEPFNVSREIMFGIVTDVWLITSGTLPLEVWQDEE